MSTQSPNQKQVQKSKMPDESSNQPDVAKIKEQLKELREQLDLKNKLVQILRRSNADHAQQQKALRTRTQAQEDRIKALETQLRNRRQQTQQPQQNQTLGSSKSQVLAQLDKLKSTQAELRNQLATLQRDLLMQRKKNKDKQSSGKANKSENQALMEDNTKLTKKVQQLQSALSQKDYQNSRVLQSLSLQLEEEKTNSKNLAIQVQKLKNKVLDLTQNLKRAENLQRQSSKPTHIETSPKVIQVVSKQSENLIKQLQAQVKQLKHQRQLDAIQKQKTRKEVESFNSRLKEVTNQKENIKFQYLELKGQFQRTQNVESSALEFDQLPSNINQQSRIEERVKDIDAEQLDEIQPLKVTHMHKDIIHRLNAHLGSIPGQQKISLLNIVQCWCLEQQQKIEISAQDLTQ